MNIREVFVPLENRVIDGVPTPFIEFKEFMETHATDDGYIMCYVDENNRIVD